MTTNQPVELGKASDETKHVDLGTGDSEITPFGEKGT
jgi:hypothetical protein